MFREVALVNIQSKIIQSWKLISAFIFCGVLVGLFWSSKIEDLYAEKVTLKPVVFNDVVPETAKKYSELSIEWSKFSSDGVSNPANGVSNPANVVSNRTPIEILRHVMEAMEDVGLLERYLVNEGLFGFDDYSLSENQLRFRASSFRDTNMDFWFSEPEKAGWVKVALEDPSAVAPFLNGYTEYVIASTNERIKRDLMRPFEQLAFNVKSLISAREAEIDFWIGLGEQLSSSSGLSEAAPGSFLGQDYKYLWIAKNLSSTDDMKAFRAILTSKARLSDLRSFAEKVEKVTREFEETFRSSAFLFVRPESFAVDPTTPEVSKTKRVLPFVTGFIALCLGLLMAVLRPGSIEQ